MDNTPLVSVIVPVYNVEKYLEECVDSITNQTYKNIEIILVDDGSTDKSGQLCDDLAKLDNRITVIHKYNEGLSSARNEGIQLAQGEYLSFIDSDDLIHGSFIEVLLNCCKKNNTKVSVCGVKEFVDGDIPNLKSNLNNECTLIEEINLYYQLYNEKNVQTIIATNKIYSKAVFEDIRYPHGKNNEDEATIHNIINNAKCFAWTNEQLYFYRQSDSSITRGVYTLKRLDEIWSKEQRLNFFKEKGLDELYQFQIYNLCSRLIYHINEVKILNEHKKIITLKQKYRTYFKQCSIKNCGIKKYIRLLFYFFLYVR